MNIFEKITNLLKVKDNRIGTISLKKAYMPFHIKFCNLMSNRNINGEEKEVTQTDFYMEAISEFMHKHKLMAKEEQIEWLEKKK